MQIRFGITGTGRISDWVLKGAVQDCRFKATAVCSRSEEHARAFIARHPECFDSDAEIYTDIADMASSANVDVVYIGTPNSTHLAYALAALKAGKHVLCEKPMGMSEAEVAQMCRQARQSGRLLMEAMVSTVNPIFRQAKAMMGQIGEIRNYSSSFCQYSSKYDALKNQGIVANSFNPQMGGGALQDVGIYTTYPLIALFGYPEEIVSNLINVPSPVGDVNIHGSIALKYPGMTADLTFSKAVDSFKPTEICGEKGNLILDQIHIARRLEFIPHGAPTSGRGKPACAQLIAEGLPKDEYFYEFEEFMNVLEEGRTESAVNSLEVSLLNARLMDRIGEKQK